MNWKHKFLSAAFLLCVCSLVLGATGNRYVGTFVGNGVGLTNIAGSNVVGIVTSVTNSTNFVNYGSAGQTNWTTTLATGFLNTNTAGGFVAISNGNVTASTGFTGNASGLTNLPIASIVSPGQIITNLNASVITLTNTVTNTGALYFGTAGKSYLGSSGSILTGSSTDISSGGSLGFTSVLNGPVNYFKIGTGGPAPGLGVTFSGNGSGNTYFDFNYGKYLSLTAVTANSTTAMIRTTFGDPPTMSMLNSTGGVANVIIGGALTTTNGLTSYGDVTISGASSDLTVGGYTTNTLGTYNLGTCYATNFILSSVKWDDSPMQFFWGASGPTAPDTTAVTNGSAINGMGFTTAGEGTQKVYGSAQIPHRIASSNSTLYTEWHLHVSPTTAYTGGNSNISFTIIYDWNNIGSTNRYGPITNTATIALTAHRFNNLLEFGHISYTNFTPSISAISRCTIMRATPANDYAGTVILDGADVHFPVDRLGSSADAAP